MIGYGKCPRCGVWGLEHLATHSHCWECNYFPEEKSDHRLWNLLEFRLSLFCAQKRAADKEAYQRLSGFRESNRPYEMELLLTSPTRGIL